MTNNMVSPATNKKFHFQTDFITTAAKMVVINIVVETAIPYAEAKLSDFLKANTIPITIKQSSQLMKGTYICPTSRSEVNMTFILGMKPNKMA